MIPEELNMMTCEEYRDEYHRLWGVAEPPTITDVMKEHIRTCPDCTSYTAGMVDLDARLRKMPDPEIPPELVRALDIIARSDPSSLWDPTFGSDIRRGV